MKTIKVKVPSNLRYISDWEGYKIPQGKCIIDKKVCGCGYTQFCLTNTDNVILCSPRISLLENKAEQNPSCHYFEGIVIKSKEARKLGLSNQKEISDYILNIQKSRVFDYLQECRKNCVPCKFMVTYDSLPKLLEILSYFQVDFGFYKTVVDEFQLIFSDARFKADVELDFINYLNFYCPNICFLSSTPMLQEYLDLLDEFKGLDYYKFDWDEHQIILPSITKIKSDNLEQSIIEIVGLYKDGKGPTKKVDGVEYRSTEAVFYVSNVSMITSVIKKLKLLPDEVNIICSKNDDNRVKIRKCGKGFKIGRAPLKGEPHKMFTFCTSTAFCGIDFYSTNAKSYVFSNCNLSTMDIDIALEIPQIIGRQRLSENVFRYDLVFYYQSNIKEISKEEFDRTMEEKTIQTQEMIKDYEALILVGRSVDRQRNLIRAGIKQYQYSNDFCSVDRVTGNPVHNNLVYLSELRAWELQNKIYDNDVSVLRVLDEIGDVSETVNFLDEIVSIPYFEDRLKKIIEHLEIYPQDISNIPNKYMPYLVNFSVDEIKSCSYRKDDLDRKLKTKFGEEAKKTEKIIIEVYKVFSEGDVYTRKEIKKLLSSVYGPDISSKAMDINLYFETSRAQITVDKITKKREDGFRLIKRKY